MPQKKFWGIFFLFLYFHRDNNFIHARNQSLFWYNNQDVFWRP